MKKCGKWIYTDASYTEFHNKVEEHPTRQPSKKGSMGASIKQRERCLTKKRYCKPIAYPEFL